jgi:hypothetical protein
MSPRQRSPQPRRQNGGETAIGEEFGLTWDLRLVVFETERARRERTGTRGSGLSASRKTVSLSARANALSKYLAPEKCKHLPRECAPT